MALTLNGNRTGAASQIDRQMQQFERQEAIRLAMLDFGDALTSLKNADPEGWESWYDDNPGIPHEIHWYDRRQVDEIIRQIKERVKWVTS